MSIIEKYILVSNRDKIIMKTNFEYKGNLALNLKGEESVY